MIKIMMNISKGLQTTNFYRP